MGVETDGHLFDFFCACNEKGIQRKSCLKGYLLFNVFLLMRCKRMIIDAKMMEGNSGAKMMEDLPPLSSK